MKKSERIEVGGMYRGIGSGNKGRTFKVDSFDGETVTYKPARRKGKQRKALRCTAEHFRHVMTTTWKAAPSNVFLKPNAMHPKKGQQDMTHEEVWNVYSEEGTLQAVVFDKKMANVILVAKNLAGML